MITCSSPHAAYMPVGTIKPSTMRWLGLAAVLVLCAVFGSSPVSASPTMEDYARLPQFDSMAISPDGSRLAWIKDYDGKRAFTVYDIEQKKIIGAVAVGDAIKARSVYFADNDNLVLVASETKQERRYLGKIEGFASVIYNLPEQRWVLLFDKTKGLHPMQGNLGRIISIQPEQGYALIPAFDDTFKTPNYNLYKVSLSSGRGRRLKLGNSNTRDWFANAKGEVIAREDFDYDKGEHAIFSYLSGKPKKIYSAPSNVPQINIVAVSWDEQHLLFTGGTDSQSAISRLNLNNGVIAPHELHTQNKEITEFLTDKNRRLIAVQYGGLLPSYSFQNEQLNENFQQLIKNTPASAVSLESFDSQYSHWVVQVSGNSAADSFYLFDPEANTLNFLASSYPNIKLEDLGEVIGVRFSARDGQKIPAVVTWPVGATSKEQRKNLPTIVLPHGGPDAHDQVRFDWLAQYLAAKGYLVMQPNFRGSTGFGALFNLAGRGRWGQEMQNDIIDATQLLIDGGYADKDRICIVGASYGGYAALMGPVRAPDMYRCVIAINAVTDIPALIKRQRFLSAQKDKVTQHWADIFGNGDDVDDFIEEASPINHVEAITPPTLLIYSKQDTVVYAKQTTQLYKRLKKVNRQSQLVALKNEDHWLSTEDMRLSTLQAIDDFLQQHNAP